MLQSIILIQNQPICYMMFLGGLVHTCHMNKWKRYLLSFLSLLADAHEHGSAIIFSFLVFTSNLFTMN
jgi:hypothetical protein